MASGDFVLLGVDELVNTMKNLNIDVQTKSCRFALRKAANLVAEAIKISAQRLDDPDTARSISGNVAVRFSNRAFKANGDLMFRVGIKHGARLPRDRKDGAGAPTPEWRLIEFGTVNMPAHPFVRPALQENVNKAISEFKLHMANALARAVKRLAVRP